MQHWHAILIALAIVGAGWLARPPTYAPIPAEGPAHARCAAMFYGAGGTMGNHCVLNTRTGEIETRY